MVKHDAGRQKIYLTEREERTFERGQADDANKIRLIAENHASLARVSEGELRAAYFKSSEALEKLAAKLEK